MGVKMDERKPKVSVIMGVYNAEKTIGKAIDSIVSQTFQDWELIICDDCSSDETYQLIKTNYGNEDRIKLLRNDSNMKLAFSLNRCLSEAKGQYIARMDADDVCFPNRFEIQAKFLDENKEFDVVGSSTEVLTDDCTYIRHAIEIPKKSDMKYRVPFSHPTIMMRKTMYDKLNGYTVLPRTVRGQDLDLWFRFFAIGGKGYNIDIPLLQYCEKKNDYKKRTIKVALMAVQTNLYGFKLLGFHLIDYVCAFKPLVSAIMPNFILYKYHLLRK